MNGHFSVEPVLNNSCAVIDPEWWLVQNCCDASQWSLLLALTLHPVTGSQRNWGDMGSLAVQCQNLASTYVPML